jgi:hypothetical protein
MLRVRRSRRSKTRGSANIVMRRCAREAGLRCGLYLLDLRRDENELGDDGSAGGSPAVGDCMAVEPPIDVAESCIHCMPMLESP